MIEIFYTNRFKKDIKRLFKKNRLIKQDVDELIEQLYLNPKSGTPLGNGCYKLRLKNTSTQKGKSGGYRVITYFIESNCRLTLLTIYSKSERSTLSDDEIRSILFESKLGDTIPL
jgi:mRNA-degrading endonuclease RelE of RelBE toxin-antitoxin system